MSYQELVEQARDFGFRKVQQTKEIAEHLKTEYEKLLEKKNALEAEILEGKIKMTSTYRKFRDLRQATERTRNLKLAYLQRSNDQFFVSITQKLRHFDTSVDKLVFFGCSTCWTILDWTRSISSI